MSDVGRVEPELVEARSLGRFLKSLIDRLRRPTQLRDRVTPPSVWTSFSKPAEVKTFLCRSIGSDTSVEHVRQVALERQMEVSELIDDTVLAAAPARPVDPRVAAKWLVQFHFDDDRRLRNLSVDLGLIGP